MNENTMIEPDKHVSLPPEVRNAGRLFYLDNLRIFLVILVVLHHVALVYGAGVPGFYYVEPPVNDLFAFLSQLVFILVNQSWFMGALFLLAGYFTPVSFDRRGPGPFLKDRALRLGIPLVLFVFVLNPVSCIGWWLMPSGLTGITTPLTLKAYPRLIGLGPLWFAALLIIFDLGYALWRTVTGKRSVPRQGKITQARYFYCWVFIILLAGATYLFRMAVPIGKTVLQFPTLAYLPQYVSFFIIGAAASRRGWLDNLRWKTGLAGFLTAAVAAVFLFPLALSGRLFTLALTPALGNAMGGGHWQSAVYSLWDSAFAVGTCLWMIPLFKRVFNGSGIGGRFVSRHGYSAYIIHIPVIVFLAYAIRNIGLANLPKFGIAALIVVPASFAAAFLFRKIPGLSKIL